MVSEVAVGLPIVLPRVVAKIGLVVVHLVLLGLHVLQVELVGDSEAAVEHCMRLDFCCQS